MPTTCAQCQATSKFEQDLDQRAALLLRRIKNFRRPMVERNNRRWRLFARMCSVPIVGDVLFMMFKRPYGLENDISGFGKFPAYTDQLWFKTESKEIREQAERLEDLKSADMDHWGDETVQPCNGNDPGGYFTPFSAPRRDCYAHDLCPFIPDKYSEFRKMASTEELVMLAETKRLHPMSDCNFFSNLREIRYYPQDTSPTRTGMDGPGFNQWLDPNAVRTVGSR